MKPEDEQPSEDELREAAALAAARENEAAGGAGAPSDALETAALLRQARAPLTVPPAHEPITAAQVAPALEGRRTPRPRRSRMWIAISVLAPAAAAGWLFFAQRPMQRGAGPIQPKIYVAPPAPSSDLLAAQAAATRGGGPAGAALARLDQEMRAYRRLYHEGLRRGHGGTR